MSEPVYGSGLAVVAEIHAVVRLSVHGREGMSIVLVVLRLVVDV